MKTIAFIPARFQSTRFQGKPLALIAGKPMIQHVYRSAGECSGIDSVYVATDDQRIYDCVMAFGGQAVMTKKEHLSGTDRIAEAAGLIHLDNDDILVNIQGDQPLFQPSIITDLIAPLKEDTEIPMSTLMYKIKDIEAVNDTNNVKVVVDKNGFALYFSRLPVPFYRDHETKTLYYKHLGFYAYRKEFLMLYTGLSHSLLEEAEKLEQLRALEYGFRIKAIETLFDSIDVNTPEDIAKVEKQLSQLNHEA